MKHFAFLALFILLLTPSMFVAAQEDPEDIILSGIVISTEPDLPGPDTEITVRADSSTTDLDRSALTWSVNGKRVASGKGIRSIEIVTGPAGSKTVIDLTVVSPDGTFNRSLTLEGDTVDLLWQGEGYVPPFYKNRTLWGYETRLTLVAIPHVVGKTAQELTFRWSRNGEVQGSSSGLGKSSFILIDSILGLPQEMTVDVLTDRNTVVASASVTLQSREPEILVYENNPALGFVFEREVGGSVLLKDKEISFSAFPLYFSTSQRTNTSVIYNWLTNSRDTKVGADVTYRVPEGKGASSVTINARSINQVLQSAEKSFLVKFDNENNF